MQSRQSLRERLVIVMLATLLPVFALSIWLAAHETRARLELAQSQLLFASSLLASTMDRSVDAAEQLLAAISAMPELRAARRDKAQCQAFFQRVRDQLKVYSNIGLLGMDGQAFCHANGPLGTASADDRAYFRDALSKGRFVMGEEIVGRLSGRRAIPFSIPLAEAGGVSGVVFATLDLQTASGALEQLRLPEGARVLVADSRGRVLMEHPPRPGLALPRELAHEEVRQAARSRTSGTGLGRDAAGQPTVFAFAPSRLVDQEGFVVRVAMARSAAIAGGYDHLHEALAVLAVAALVAMAVIWRMGDHFIVKPAQQLLGVLRKLEAGRLDARVPLPSGPPRGEFARMGAAFNLMADSLQMRQREAETELGRSRNAYAVLELVLNSMQEALIAVTHSGQILMFNEAAQRLFPLQETSFPQQWPQLFGIYHADRTTLYRTDDLPLVRSARGESGRLEALYVCNALVPEGRLLQCSWQPIRGEQQVQGGLVMFTDVTQLQRLRADQGAQFLQLQETRRKLAEAQRVGRIGNWELDLPGGRLWWSEPVFEALGLDRASFQPTLENFDSLIHPDDRARHRAARDAAIAEGTTLDIEYRVIRPDAQVAWMHDIAATRAGDEGRTAWIGGVVQDITARKRVEAELILLRNAVAQLNDIVIISEYSASGMFDPHIVFANEALERLLGCPAQEAIGRTPSALGLYGERTDRQTLARMRESLAQGQAARGELLHYARGGRERWLDVEVVPMPGERGEPAYLISVMRDATARKEAERALMQSEGELQAFARLLQRTADAVRTISSDQTVEGTLQAAADQARELTNSLCATVELDNEAGEPVLAVRSVAPVAAARNDGLESWFAPAAPAWPSLDVPMLDAAGRPFGRLRLEKASGAFGERDHHVAAELAQMAAIAIHNARLLDQIRDLNSGLEARIAQRAAELARQEQLYRTLAEQAPEVVWNTDAQGRATFLNQAWYDLVGGTPGEWLGYRWLDKVHPDDIGEVQRNWARSRDTLQPHAGTRRIRARDGSYHTMSYKAAPVLDEQGHVASWVGIDADITQYKAIERALRSSNQELEAFSYSVSHDLRAPLGAVSGFSRALAGKLEGHPDERVRHYLSRIGAGVEKMEQLIEALLSLSKVVRAPLHFGEVDLSALARDAIEGLQMQHPQRQVEVQVHDGLKAQGDARLLRLVVDNLLGNAWKFSARREHARIEVGRRDGGPGFFVRDNGVGFDMAYADKLFTAFQRLHTEAEFPGTGIGLATVRRIIARHQGRVWVESQPNVGTTFYFTLSDAALPAWLSAGGTPDSSR